MVSERVALIAGPTASGKSALAAELARALGGVVINADAMQVYRDLDILSARPAPEEARGVPHRLYGVLDAAESCSAARWAEMAAREIAAAHAAGKLPVLAGGTGLYFHALLEGLAPVPQVDPGVRASVRALLAREGAPALHRRLAALDPEMAARLAPADGQRIARALEVLESSGRSLACWQRAAPTPILAGPILAGMTVDRLALELPRADLHARCDARFDVMMAQGALDEVRRLAARRLDPALPAMKALGVPPLLRHLAGEIDETAAVAAAKLETRRYAKRQTTWIRNRFADWPRADARDPAAALARFTDCRSRS